MRIPEKPAHETFTDEQWKAIYASGKDILVSAAAGSGKTKVLITRMIEKVLNTENPIDVDQLLVVTFTNAAAAEMRHRMASALEAAIANDPASVHLRRQLNLLNKAQISSLHSFCLQVVRQYSYVLDIDPGFRIADPAEASILRDDTVAAVLEDAYSRPDPEAIYRLSDSFTADRNDQAIETLIDKLYDYSRVHPNPAKWLEMIPQQYEIGDDAVIDGLSFIGPLKLAIKHTLDEAKTIAQDLQRLAEMNEGPLPLLDTAKADEAWLNQAIDYVTNGKWEDAYAYFQTLTWVKAGMIKKDSCDEELAKRGKDMRDSVKRIVNKLKETYFTRTPARLLEEIRLMAPLMHTLVELVEDFSARYQAVKAERGLVDFSDLEHYALQILSAEEDGQLTPSDIALDYQARFAEVLVDEYQDTNFLQEAILQLIKQGAEADGNLFMVGDVKQSIYRFRLAEPGLFLGKYDRFLDDPSEQGLKIDLNANFRSRREVLDATNFIFRQIMGTRVGEIEYDEAAALKYGAQYPDKEAAAGLTILYENEEDEELSEEQEAQQELKKSQVEARFIAQKIKQWQADQAQTADAFSGRQRPIEYRDIVILMRSMTWSSEIADELKAAGIPVYVELSSGYFDAIEVMIMLNTLRVIDNPYQDIPLVSVLRAPFVGLTENELAEIRLVKPNAPFYEAVQLFVQTGGAGVSPAAQKKLQKFFIRLEDWRNMARHGSLSELIWKVYQDTYYYEMVGILPNGKQRQANLRALHDRAMSYEKTSFRGLFRFLRFIDRMRKRGDDLGEARFMSEKENVVRIMTIHSSKGLEFPYVFLAGMGRPFNKMDFHNPYLFDQHFGLAVKAIDPEKRITFTSLPFLAVKEKKELEMRAEEMRVLYVAMTRAKEHLELIASVKDIEKTISQWQEAQLLDETAPLPEYKRSRAAGYLDWIGPAVARHMDFGKFGKAAGGELMDDASVWDINAYPFSAFHSSDSTEIDDWIPLDNENLQADPQLVETITQRFETRYPYKYAVELPSKQSVSELKRIALLELERGDADPFEERSSDFANRPSFLHDRPSFLQKRQLTKAEVGTAMHTVMQHLDLKQPLDVAEAEHFIAELVERELLTKEEGTAIKASDIVKFFAAPLGERMKQADEVLREMPFTYALPAEQGEFQLLQGIADCLFHEDGEWVLVDYKTDYTGNFHSQEEVANEMQKRYGTQLSLYKKVLQSILGIDIKEMLLYLFDGAKTISLQEELV
ncbi:MULTISPECIES: helicase-exonuclease AddAB subunit AddA [unclassified Sporosarcina]|uniref:helicase-exonuclease AddAB subunit AddA n=1 Tax=unclassified Sporosarcina TaxID=2647733 RepID=UPI00203D6F2C|nr:MULTISPECIES: helicase-exonuclease AddAB subunit AddA [unclassified Sporosarcina]GKV65821.1 ATP-dependent helicase/nuclease subunit A [Sporosarcina sp. NCCP-2331]GLB55945.1 ATP-dependent helicase/nuclease subunit A [Sporosarcina sp. NCCP-2378]